MAVAAVLLATAGIAGLGAADAAAPGPAAKAAKTAARADRQNLAASHCPPFPKKGFRFNPHFKLPGYPPGSTVTFPSVEAGCAYIVGFSDARKLGEAALIGPGLANIQVARRLVRNDKANYFQSDSTGKLYYKPCPGTAPECRAVNSLPPAQATFLSFGFMPTEATLQITQTGTLDIATVGTLLKLRYSKVMSLASIRIAAAQVNGVPLDVGSNCHTVRPFRLVLTGRPPYSLQAGGALTGTIRIPPFTGCGVGQNLDPLFTGPVSGAGNVVKLTQGNLCTDFPPPSFGCPPTVPVPIH